MSQEQECILATSDILEEPYKIHSYEVDMNGNAHLPALCRFMQESAWNHAEQLGFGFTDLAKQGYLWVLARQLVEMKTYPKWGDTVTLQTWPSARQKILCFRDFRLFDEKRELLGAATTTWFAIDLKTRRPQPTDRYFTYAPPADCRQAVPERASKLSFESPAEGARKFVAGFHAIDVNGHVNNVTYLEWLIESHTLDFLQTHTLARLEINFLGEAAAGDTIVARLRRHSEQNYQQSLTNQSSGKELCRAVTTWRS